MSFKSWIALIKHGLFAVCRLNWSISPCGLFRIVKQLLLSRFLSNDNFLSLSQLAPNFLHPLEHYSTLFETTIRGGFDCDQDPHRGFFLPSASIWQRNNVSMFYTTLTLIYLTVGRNMNVFFETYSGQSNHANVCCFKLSLFYWYHFFHLGSFPYIWGPMDWMLFGKRVVDLINCFGK